MTPERQILAVRLDPEIEKAEFLAGQGFAFCGYDLVEDMGDISAITNCGAAFAKAIPYEELNELGLIFDYALALKTREELRRIFPHEEHADCMLVEIWRKTL